MGCEPIEGREKLEDYGRTTENEGRISGVEGKSLKKLGCLTIPESQTFCSLAVITVRSYAMECALAVPETQLQPGDRGLHP